MMLRIRKKLKILLAIGLSAGIGATCARDYLQERHDLPPFDQEKAKTLSHEKRAAYERDLFNELPAWNTGSPRFWDSPDREKYFLRMANEGYELPHIVLQIIAPSTGYVYKSEKPFKRLLELAEGGNTGAMCVLPNMLSFATQEIGEAYGRRAQQYLLKGAGLNHPQCVAIVGHMTLNGLRGQTQDKKKGFEMLIEASRAGYSSGLNAAWRYFYMKGNAELATTMERRQCWAFLGQKYSLNTSPDVNLGTLKRELEKTGRADLRDLHQRLLNRTYVLEDCIALGLGELT